MTTSLADHVLIAWCALLNIWLLRLRARVHRLDRPAEAPTAAARAKADALAERRVAEMRREQQDA